MTQPLLNTTAITLAWGAKVSTGFARSVLALCADLRWGAQHPSWLMACMAFETAETFSPRIRNGAGSGAVGLIQFMPAIAADLGTTVENLQLLTAEAQLYYVQQYFKPYAARVSTLSDMYMAILLPRAIGQPDEAVLFSGGAGYRQNVGFDTNRDGKITKMEATALVAAKLQRGLQPGYVAQYAGVP